MVCIDYFFKWVEVFLVFDQIVCIIVKVLFEVVVYFGCFMILYLD